jgi:hypothetical protein
VLEGFICVAIKLLADPELCGGRDDSDDEMTEGNTRYDVEVADVVEEGDMRLPCQ